LSARRVFVYVQHLLGVGHLKRAATLARALVEAGLEVTLASGGAPVPDIAPEGARFVQLPAASAADLSFRTLLDERGKAIDPGWMRRRAEALLGAWRAAVPHVLVLELFPFGRRQMRFELLPLLEAARAAAHPPAVVCSVRDILGGQKSPERQEETIGIVGRLLDHVLVHSDPSVIAFERTFPLAGRIADRIHYTGYVVDRPVAARQDTTSGAGEVLVSAGGGAVGAPLLEAAMRARPLSAFRDRTWRVLAGDNMNAEAYARLAGLAQDGIVLERSRPDFTSLLANCELSVSQAGYNTLMETLAARARAVVVPFAGGAETEQTLRARCFAERGLLEVVEEDALAPQTLAAALERAARRPRPAAPAIDLNGARKSAELIGRWAAERGG
jgi:predicted glycosyltransferase